MKKEYIFLLIIFLAQNFYSQQSLGEGSNSAIASPSMASMATFTDMPVNKSAGLPQINIPLLTVPTDQNYSYGFNLAYNPAGVDSEYVPASDVGAGWSLFGGGVIYKKIIGSLDESFDDPNRQSYEVNTFDDFYYYNLPNASGKFQIKRNTANNTFALVNLTPNNLKIEYIRDSSNTTTLKIDKFTVTDDHGYRYEFNDYDYEKTTESPQYPLGYGYKSAYYLSKIVNPSGVIIATLDYDKKSKSTTIAPIKLLYQYCKLKTITTGLGQVVFNYQYDESLSTTPNDLYNLLDITLKDTSGQVIYSYNLNYIKSNLTSIDSKKKRLLNYIRKNDKDGVKIEQTSFVYNQTYTPRPTSSDYNNNLCSPGEVSIEPTYYDNYKFGNILEKIIYPSGGAVSYEYGYHELFVDHNTPEYFDLLSRNYVNPDIQTIIQKPEVNYDTDLNTIYTFTLTGDPSKKKAFILNFTIDGYHENTSPINPHPVDLYTTYVLKRNGQIINGNSCYLDNPQFQMTYYDYPGTYTIEISSTRGYGVYMVSELNNTVNPPYRNAQKSLLFGPRLKNIKSYNSSSDTTPQRTISYNYDRFDGTGSSGYSFSNGADLQTDATEPFILYTNVKESEIGAGYTKYTYLTPLDYPKYQNGGTQLEPTYYYPYYNITAGTLLCKQEAFNDQDQLVSSEAYIYELDNYTDQTYQFFINSSLYTSNPAYVKKINTSNKSYTANGGMVENKKESFINISNLQPGDIKETTATGDIVETQFTYPIGVSGYTQLQNANIISDPIQTVIKNNGKITSSKLIKYDNSSILPTSIVSVNPNDNSLKTLVKNDVYDSKGNLKQFTTVSDEASGQGFPTTIIWGYNETYPIARIEGATITDVNTLAADMVTKSNLDIDDASEKTLLQAMDTFRTNAALNNFRITTYTYNPLIGTTSITSPNGIREVYRYDKSGKLQYIIDVNGNILKDYRYNTKPQP